MFVSPCCEKHVAHPAWIVIYLVVVTPLHPTTKGGGDINRGAEC